MYIDGKLARVIAPGNRVQYWRGALAVTFDLIDVRENPEGASAPRIRAGPFGPYVGYDGGRGRRRQARSRVHW